MSTTSEELAANHLTADELLAARGIGARVSDNYAKVSIALPKTGAKLFEPDDSWLQKKQLDSSLEARKDLIEVERVTRLSALASAEWLSDERRAKVTKKSGVDWHNYGIEECGSLYINPEEALLLLELHTLELYYNEVSLSIQQAYEVLIDSPNSDCTLSEYRVFSYLAKLGYPLQRFQYVQLDSEQSGQQIERKKKEIVDSENSQWMKKPAADLSIPVSERKDSAELIKAIEDVVANLVDQVGSQDDIRVETVNVETQREVTKPKGKPEIVSVKTVVDPVKIVASDNKSNKWIGSRIQRNVKLLPKRMDKKVNDKQNTNEKRKAEPIVVQVDKKAKPEVIDVSDDDIEEIPQKMSRMEMLNCLPNVASKGTFKTQVIPRGYIPHNIKPQKPVYEYNRGHHLRNQGGKNFVNTLNSSRRRHDGSFANRNARPLPHHGVDYTQTTHHNFNVGLQNGGHSHRSTAFRGSSGLHVFGSITSRFTLHHQYQPRMNRNSSRKYGPHGMPSPRQSGDGPSSYRSDNISVSGNNINNTSVDADSWYFYESSFPNMPANSWSELKKKWKDSKIITTIDVEDNKMDCSEVEVIQQSVQPLVNPRNAQSLAEIYERLRIIKPAQEQTERKKKTEYKISYKIFSNTQHYRKSNPGTPMCHLVIVNQKSEFLASVELNRLLQDADGVTIIFAHVCRSSITFTHAGIVSLPDFIDC